MNPIDGKMRYLVIKKETTPGTAADMSSGTIAIAISDVSFQDQIQKIEDKFASGGYTQNVDIKGEELGEVTFKHNIVVSTTHTDELPAQFLLSGYPTDGQFYYEDKGVDLTCDTITAWYVQPSVVDGYHIVAKMRGCLNDWSIEAKSGEQAVLNCKLTGALYSFSTIASGSVPAYTAPANVTKPLVWKGGISQADGQDIRWSSITVNPGLSIAGLKDPSNSTGILRMVIIDRKPTLKMNKEVNLISNTNQDVDDFENGVIRQVDLHTATIPTETTWIAHLHIQAPHAMIKKIKGNDKSPMEWAYEADLVTTDPNESRLNVILTPFDTD